MVVQSFTKLFIPEQPVIVRSMNGRERKTVAGRLFTCLTTMTQAFVVNNFIYIIVSDIDYDRMSVL